MMKPLRSTPKTGIAFWAIAEPILAGNWPDGTQNPTTNRPKVGKQNYLNQKEND
ncbi:hypothetical protein KFE98_17135 [bacterium SCSIO 12741]|nr:hypothetical protein KFE98_17135 [bacterium SCSIO 12741]